MSTKVSPLGLRLFLEGVEVPVISASVTVQPDRPATAAIQIIPTDMSLYLLPRTLVHLFYLDDALDDDEIAVSKATFEKNAGRGGVRPTLAVEEDSLNRYQASDFSYKLMYSGEVIGFNYQKTPTGRQQILQCMDLSSYWDTCFQFFADYSPGGNALTDKHHNFVGSKSGLFDNFGGHQWVISRLINTKPRSPEYQETEGLLGGLIHLLESVGGIKYRDASFPGFKGMNDFFTIAELRYNLLGMLGAIQADKTSAKLYASKAFNQWIKNGMTSLGTLVSFRDIINHLNRYIFHNIYPNPCARYKARGSSTETARKKVGSLNVMNTAVGASSKLDLKRALSKIGLALAELDVLIKSILRLGPATNVPARSVLPTQSLNGVHAALQAANLILDQQIVIIEGLTQADDTKEVVEALRGIRGDVLDAQYAIPLVSEDQRKDAYTRANSSAGKVLGRLEEAQTLATGASNALYDLFSFEKARVKTVVRDVPTSDHLFNQLFLPETFFVSPPRCNVIFPDQYYEIKFSRNFLRETSRLAMQGGLGMLGGGRRGAQMFGRFYLAPKIKDVSGRLVTASLSQGSRIILQHEVHSGIVPKYTWVTDGHRWGVKAAAGTKTLSQVKQSQKIHYLQRLAEFQFYLHRWSARQLTLTGIFNPNIVAGLPAVILDRSSPSPAVLARLEKTLRRRATPTQFLGKVFTYSHNIGQDGGSTSIQFAFARTHKGLDDEFLGTLTKEVVTDSVTETVSVEPLTLANGVDAEEQRSKQAEAAAQAVADPQGLGLVAQGIVDSGGRDADEVAGGSPQGIGLAAQNLIDDIAATRSASVSKMQAKVSKQFEWKKHIVRLYVEDKLKSPVKVKGLGRVETVEEHGDIVRLNKFHAQSLGISDSVFESKAVEATVEQANASARGLGSVAVGLIGGTGGTVKVLELPATIVLSYKSFRSTGKWTRSDVAIEDALRPEWMAEDVWTNENVTEKVYGPLLGTAAITDDKSIGQDAQDELLKRWTTEQLKRIDPETSKSAGSVTAVGEIDSKHAYSVVSGSVEETVDGLSLVYGMIKDRGGDVHEFIREFTRRPIANLVDVLGSQNLEFDAKGEVVDPGAMIEGFHSRAFGDYNTDVQLPDREGSTATAGKKALGALMPGESNPGSVKRQGIIGKDDTKTAIRPEFDPRGRARGRVRAYVEELRVSRGLLGS